MVDLDNLKLERGQGSPELPDEPQEPSGRRWRKRLVVASLFALILLAQGVGLFLWLRSREAPRPVAQPEPQAAQPEPGTSPTAAADGGPSSPVTLPPLDESDSLLRRLARTLSPSEELARLLLEEDLVRRFVVVVDNVAEGASPRPHLLFLAPEERLETVERQGRLFIDPQSYVRFDGLVDLIASLDAQECARLYRLFRPLLDRAYRDLGYPHRSFDETVRQALRRILQTTPALGAEVVPATLSYEYRDPELEALTPAQKDFLRLGPKNMAKIQAKVRQLLHALEMED